MSIYDDLVLGLGLEDLDETPVAPLPTDLSNTEVVEVITVGQIAEAAGELKEAEQEIVLQQQVLDQLEDRRENLEEQVASLEALFNAETFDRGAVRERYNTVVSLATRYGAGNVQLINAGTEDINDAETARVVYGAGLEALGATLKSWGVKAWEMIKKIFSSIVSFFTSFRKTVSGVRERAKQVSAKLAKGTLKETVSTGGWGKKLTVSGELAADPSKTFSSATTVFNTVLKGYTTKAAANFTHFQNAFKGLAGTSADSVIKELNGLEFPVPEGAIKLPKQPNNGKTRYAVKGMLGNQVLVLDVATASGEGIEGAKAKIKAFGASGAGIATMGSNKELPKEIKVPAKASLDQMVKDILNLMSQVDSAEQTMKLSTIESQLKSALTGSAKEIEDKELQSLVNVMKPLPAAIARSFASLPVKLCSAAVTQARAGLDFVDACAGGKAPKEEKPEKKDDKTE